MQGSVGKPVYRYGVLGAGTLAVSGFIYALTKHPIDLIEKTGSPIVPSTSFLCIQGLVFICMAIYLYRLFTVKCDVHANLMSVPMALSLTLLGVGWIFVGHDILGLAAAAVGAAAAILTLSVLYYTQRTTQTVLDGAHPLDVVTPYLPPGWEGYLSVISTVSTISGWLWVLFYVLLIANLFGEGNISSHAAAGDILIAIFVVVVFVVAQQFDTVNEPFIWWLSIISISSNIEGSSLHAVIWAAVGLSAGFFIGGMRERMMNNPRFHVSH